MFATRANQENAVHAQQLAPTGKPLAQSSKHLAPKTPAKAPNASKTPWKAGRNDENGEAGFGQPGGKEGKEGKVDRSAFVTPANTRVRAPLGAKTGNVKALRTPSAAPAQDRAQSSVKPTSPRLRRSKIKVHAGELETRVVPPGPEEREIEYMPPREIPLPDHPDDIWPHDREYPELQGKNFTRGWWAEYAPRPKDDDDDSDFEERYRKAVAEEERRDQAEATSHTVTAKDAASALSNPSQPARRRPAASNFAAPTIAAKARQPAVIKKPSPIDRHPRFTAAKAASNSTIGYSKGRAVSSSSMRSLGDIHVRPASAVEEPPVSAEVHERALRTALKLSELFITDDVDDALAFPSMVERTGEGAFDEFEDFQLDPVEEV